MRYTVHVYTARGEFAQFLFGYNTVQDACEAAADHIATRPGYRAEVKGRPHLFAPATLHATVVNGRISYV